MKNIPSLFVLVSIMSSFATISVSCNKEVKGYASGSAGVVVASGSAGEVTASAAKSDDSSQVKRDAVDNNKLFTDLLEKEREERIQEDKKINERIDVLDGKVTLLSKTVSDEVARLDSKDVEIEKKLAASELSFNLKIVSLDGKLDSSLVKLKTELQEDVKKQLSELDAHHNEARLSLEKEIKILIEKTDADAQKRDAETNLRIAELNQNLTNLDDQLKLDKAELSKQMSDDKKLLSGLLEKNMSEIQYKLSLTESELSGKILAIAEEQAAFKEYASTTYATKSELRLVKEYAEGIMSVTNILGKKIDQNDAETRKLISDTAIKIQTEVNQNIATVEASVKGLRTDFMNHVLTYQNTIKKLSTEMQDEVYKLRTDMVTMRGDILSQQTDLRKDLLGKMSKQAAEFEYKMQTTKDALSDKLIEINNRVDLTDSEIQKAKAEVQQSINVAIKNEQAARNKMQEELDKLRIDLEKVQKIAEQTQQLADANQKEIAKLRGDFEGEKKSTIERFIKTGEDVNKLKIELDKGLADVRGDMEKKFNEVTQKAAELVKNLGSDVQKQFQNIAVDLAQLEQKQVATASTLNTFMEELSADKNRQAQFEKDVVTPRQDSLAALADLIKAVNEAEIAFIFAINPDQKAPDFYNESFKPIMNTCGGNPKATFANALGSDSFKFLAQEYVQQLVFGMRGTIADPIFFGKGQMLNSENLHKLTTLAALRYTVGSESEKCVQDIKSWGQKVLINPAPEAEALRKKILANNDLNRAVAKVQEYVNKLADPLARLEAVIVASLKGQKAAEDLLKSIDPNRPAVLPRYAISLIEAAQNQFALNDKQNNFNAIVEIQNKFAAENADLKKQIDTQKPALDGLIAEFKKSNQEQIAKVTDTTKLADTLKKALDVMLTLSIRAGYGDLKDDVINAAKDIAYVPVEKKLVKASIVEIQHFFANDAAKAGMAAIIKNGSNRVAAVSGVDIATCMGENIQRGILTQYPNKCWVNFRDVPTVDNYAGTLKTLKFRVFGAARKIVINNTSYDLSVPGVLKAGSFGEAGVFDIATPNVIPNPAANVYDIAFNAQGDNGSVANYSYRIQLYSPIVLDFMSIGMPKSQDLNASIAKFDLKANGNVTRHGWIAGDEAAFLGIDVDGSRKITSGSQLFGEATKLADGSRASNGYLALKQYDANKDGVIDAQDPIFTKLVAWFDYNANGVSDANEVKYLTEVGVTKLAVNYDNVALNKQFDNGNNFRYQAKFWGPQNCPKDGCNSYDVFFSTSSKVAQAK